MEKNAALQYRTQQILTASPSRQVAMLFDEAIWSLRKVIAAVEKGEIEGRWKANRKAAEIIGHLDATLDMEKGGEIAENLTKLYSFMLNRLVDVDIQNDQQPAQEVISLLEPLRQSWYELANQAPADRNAQTGDQGSAGPDAAAPQPGSPRVYSAA